MSEDEHPARTAGSGTGRTRGPSPEKTARTRAAILAAAMAEFLERGFAAATMAGIARRAGIAKGTSYLYFETKEALFAGIVQDVVTSPLCDAENQPIADGETVADYFRRTLLPVMASVEEAGRAAVARLVIAEGARFPFLISTYREAVYAPFLTHLRRCAQLAVARGELKDDTLVRLPHLLAAPLWIAILNNGVLAPGEAVDPASLFDAQIRLAFGEAAPAAGAR
ncbi:TetR/AcrR family transcriptional regulator [Pseudoxanthobacter sp.]|uniref:TetR/AcrR family transcriptional regulator n=1 Tax=Pseudoxanthobacter sp. TaxID=1925742 RepID=UPI002FE2E2DC